jgi:hypothetical protein
LHGWPEKRKIGWATLIYRPHVLMGDTFTVPMARRY